MNAGGVMLPSSSAETWSVNVEAPVRLSRSLLGLLERGWEDGLGRVVNLSSATLWAAESDPVWTETTNSYSPHAAYANSKLAIAIASQLLAAQTPVEILSLHPGVIPTPLYRHVLLPFRLFIRSLLGPTILSSPSKAASDVVNLCLRSEAVSGGYYENGRPLELPRVSRASRQNLCRLLSIT